MSITAMADNSPPFFVLTGPPGAGKTTLLEALGDRVKTVDEPARRVLARARKTGNGATGEENPEKFISHMLRCAREDYRSATGLTVFDRAVPDLLVYCEYYELSDQAVIKAVQAHPYRSPVFFLPAWEEIYETDDERTLTFSGALAFGERVKTAYQSSGYGLLTVPVGDPAARADFVWQRIRN